MEFDFGLMSDSHVGIYLIEDRGGDHTTIAPFLSDAIHKTASGIPEVRFFCCELDVRRGSLRDIGV